MKTAKLVPEPILKTLAYVCKLNSSAMNKLAEETYLEALKKGENLFHSGFSDPSTFYLLSGEVSLVAEGKDDEVINAKTPEAKKPLAREKPRKVSAVAKTDVIFIRISDEALAEVASGDSDGEIDAASIEKNILQDITEALKNNKLIIPSLPDIALQIRKAVQDPNTDAVKISKIIQADPALTARIIQVANSPIYRGNSTITGCRLAVSRMGVQITRYLVTGCTLQTLFESDSEMLEKRMEEFWKYSVHIAALCAVIARFSRQS